MESAKSTGQATAYCLRCKSKHVILNPQPSTFKNGTPIITGQCEVCGGKLFRIVSKAKAV